MDCIPALAAALVLGGAAQGGSIKAVERFGAASDFSSKKGGGGKGHAKGHAKGHVKHANKYQGGAAICV